MKKIIIEILPTLLAFVVTGIPLIYFMVNKHTKGIIVTSFVFLLSGFSIQILIDNGESIKNFADHYHNVFSFPLVTVLGTTTGIFLGNQMLRYLANKKERREIAILMTSAIDSHIINLGFINLYTLFNNISMNEDFIRLYKSELDNDEAFKVSFNCIGIYEENEIKLISEYYTQLRQCLNYLERLLILSKNGHRTAFLFPIVKTSLAFTIINGALCTYIMSSRYSSNSKTNFQNRFLDEYNQIIHSLIKEFKKSSMFYVLDNKFSSDIINNLKDIRNKYQDASNSFELNNHEREVIYICRVCIDAQYNPPSDIIHKVQIKKNDYFIAFGNSQEESIEKCIELIMPISKKSFNDQQINKIINKSQFETHIVSPWG